MESKHKVHGNDDKYYTQKYFDALIDGLQREIRVERNIALILVCHIVPTLPYYLNAMKKIGRIAAIIPKGSAHDQDLIEFLDEHYSESFRPNITRKHVENSEGAIDFINSHVRDNEQGVIVDIGGYFAAALPAISTNRDLLNKVVGIVEDTENGHKRYSDPRILNSSKIPIFSVAQCELKRTEDYNVGKAIVRAADALLRVDAHTITERLSKIGVIGYGKIGHGIAYCLREMGVKELCICEIDPIRAMLASSHGFKLVSKQYVMSQCDAIYCATGNKSLAGNDFAQLKDNVFVVSCTSEDDEFDLEWLKTQQVDLPSSRKHNTFLYRIANTSKIVNLMHNGNAVNFLFNAVVGPFIYSVQGALITSVLNLASQRGELGRVNILSKSEESFIAQVWLRSFSDMNQHGEIVVNLPLLDEEALIEKCKKLSINETAHVENTIIVEKGGKYTEKNIVAKTLVLGTSKGISGLVLDPSMLAFLRTTDQVPTQQPAQGVVRVQGTMKRENIVMGAGVLLDDDEPEEERLGNQGP